MVHRGLRKIEVTSEGKRPRGPVPRPWIDLSDQFNNYGELEVRQEEDRSHTQLSVHEAETVCPSLLECARNRMEEDANSLNHVTYDEQQAEEVDQIGDVKHEEGDDSIEEVTSGCCRRPRPASPSSKERHIEPDNGSSCAGQNVWLDRMAEFQV